MVKTLYLEETDSTNDFLRQYTPGEDENMTVVWTDFDEKVADKVLTIGRVRQERT